MLTLLKSPAPLKPRSLPEGYVQTLTKLGEPQLYQRHCWLDAETYEIRVIDRRA